MFSLYIRELPGIKSPFRERYSILSELKSQLNNPRFDVCAKNSTSETLADIYNCVEIWGAEYAQQILLSISEVFVEINPKRIDFD